MANTQEEEVIRKLRERATRGELNGVDISYRVTGGAPGEKVFDEELRVSGPGPVHARLRTVAAALQESSEQLAEPELKTLLLQISEGVRELIPRSEARFIPDTVVGQVSVRVDGQEASFFFLPDAEQAKQHGKVIPEKAMRLVGALDALHKRIIPR